MTFLRKTLLIMAMAVCACACKPTDGIADGDYHIVICATTDIHGAYFDRNYDGFPNKSSLANVSGYMKQLRASGVDPILIDTGDNLQGDNASYYFNYVDTLTPHIYPRMAEYIGYDAVVVGNHDVETGHGVYDRLAMEFTIPLLAANAAMDRNEDGEADIESKLISLKPSDSYFSPYCIVERQGFKVAIIGMTNANIKSWISSNLWHGMDFQVISDIAQAQVDYVIRRENPQVVVLAVHSGTGDGEPGNENEALYLAQNLKDVDLVLCGHDHRPYADVVSNGRVGIMNEGTKAEFVGKADINITLLKGKVANKYVSCELVPMEKYDADQDFVEVFEDDYEKVCEFANKPVGSLSENIFLADALDGPSSYLNLVHTVQMEASGADISIAAPLASHGVIPAGTIAFKDLVSIYKYENQLYVVELTGQQVKDYLEYTFDHWINKEGMYFDYDSADGIIYTVSKSAPMGSRVNIESMCDGTPFELDRTYKIAMTSYRASGAGKILSEGAGVDPDSLVVLDKFKDIRSLIGEYFADNGEIVPKVSTNWKFIE